MALFGLTLTKVEPATAATAPGSTPASVSLAIAPQWPWGAAVNPVMPAYLSPDPGPDGGGVNVSGTTMPPGSGGRTGIRAPLIIVPLLVTVNLGHPPIFPPFNVHVVTTGDALTADSVTFDVPFPATLPLALGRVQTQEWLGIFPVALEPGSLVFQATLVAQSSTAGSAQAVSFDPANASTTTLSGDFSQVPLTTTLSDSDQNSLAQFAGDNISSGFGVQTLFALINDATVSAKTKLLEIQNRRSAISIGDMFEMQMLVNKMNDLDELSTTITSSINDAITSMARNLKG